MAFNYFLIILLLGTVSTSCKTEKPAEVKKPEPTVIVKPKVSFLSPQQRAELAFPEDLLYQIELAAGAEAEPFVVTVVVPSENMKG